jgi:hypothetical protein
MSQSDSPTTSGLPEGKLVMFNAVRGLDAPQKGGAGVQRIMAGVRQQLPEARLVVMGGDVPATWDGDDAVHYIGQLHDDAARALAFSGVDASLMPSERESFGNVMLESLACGHPWPPMRPVLHPRCCAQWQAVGQCRLVTKRHSSRPW